MSFSASLRSLTGSMVGRAGAAATRNCKPRQARKGATVAVDSGAGVWLVRSAAQSPQASLVSAIGTRLGPLYYGRLVPDSIERL